jgi:1-acyl-sn-glycerol-3-phosphate acyltransferase
MFESIIGTYRGLVAFFLMGISGSIALALRMVTFGKSVNWGSKYIVAPSSRLILKIIGVRYQLPKTKDYPAHQVMYTFNHNSFLDVLVLTALAIPNTRFFLSEKTRKIIPLTLSALAIGVYYIPVKKDKKRRADFFKNVTQELRNGSCSVFVSSEGVHRFIHGISHFNTGVYEMALKAKLPVQPVYLHIPKETNSLEGYRFKSGTISVHLLQEEPTENWQFESIKKEIEKVRVVFLNEFTKRND